MSAHTRGADPYGLIGQVLDGQFRVDKFVGEGGFSSVYKGQHLGLDEPIAIKCLKLPTALGSALVESFVRRFRDESRLHYRLSQGNLSIARSIASGTTLAPATSALVPYMVLEWLDGVSLAEDFAQRKREAKRGRPLNEVVKLLDSAVQAVAYAHSQGVVHRDLNPGNFFLAKSREGTTVKVLDFGVAKVVSDHALELGPRAQTIGQIRIFAPAYGAPEQFDDSLGKIGPWTDVYALALIVLEALTDRTVVEGEYIGEFAMRALDPNRRPSPSALGIAVGAEIDQVLSKAVTLKPADRYQDAGEFWGALKNAIRRETEVIRTSELPMVVSGLHSTVPMASVPQAERLQGGTLRLPGSSEMSQIVKPQISTVMMPSSPQHAVLAGLRSGVATTAPMADASGLAQAHVPGDMTSHTPGVAQARVLPTPVPPALAHASPGSPNPGGAPSFESGYPPESIRPPARSLNALWFGIGALALIAIGVVIFWVYDRQVESRVPGSGIAISSSGETAPSSVPSAPSGVPVEPSATAPRVTGNVVPTSPSSSAGADPHAFSVESAKRELHNINGILASCRKDAGINGPGRISITFNFDGTVKDAVIKEPPYAGTPDGACVISRFRAAKVPPFEGQVPIVEYTFTVPAP